MDWSRLCNECDGALVTVRAIVAVDDLTKAWSLLLDSSDAIADSITLTLFERNTDVYDGVGPEVRADVRASSRQHIRRGLEILAGHTDARGSAVQLWRETGRRRARQGVPLETVLNAYTMGARVLWEALVARVSASEVDQPTDQPVDQAVLLEAARMSWSNLDTQNGVLIEAYRRESRRLERADLQRHHAVLDGLLEGRGADPEYAAEALTTLGLGAEDRVACVVVLDEADVSDGLGATEDRLDRQGVATYWQLHGGVYFGLLAGDVPDESALAELFSAHAPGRIGVAASPDGIAGFATAHLLATRAAETLPRGERRAVSVRDRLPEVLLQGSPQVTPLLIAQTLGPLLGQPEAQRETLLQTLAALLRHDGSPTHAAEELFCHRNTVIYRLKQIESLTGRSLTEPRDKMLLGLALVADGRG